MKIDHNAVRIAHEKRESAWQACRGSEESSTLEIIEWYEAAKSEQAAMVKATGEKETSATRKTHGGYCRT